ncbi:hypothetical protein FKM82_008784 [Ascaphus truei]
MCEGVYLSSFYADRPALGYGFFLLPPCDVGRIRQHRVIPVTPSRSPEQRISSPHLASRGGGGFISSTANRQCIHSSSRENVLFKGCCRRT